MGVIIEAIKSIWNYKRIIQNLVILLVDYSFVRRCSWFRQITEGLTWEKLESRIIWFGIWFHLHFEILRDTIRSFVCRLRPVAYAVTNGKVSRITARRSRISYLCRSIGFNLSSRYVRFFVSRSGKWNSNFCVFRHTFYTRISYIENFDASRKIDPAVYLLIAEKMEKKLNLEIFVFIIFSSATIYERPLTKIHLACAFNI